MIPFTRAWMRELDLVEKVFDIVIILALISVFVGMTHSFITFHDPARMAAFNPCDHSKAHKRPVNCPKR